MSYLSLAAVPSCSAIAHTSAAIPGPLAVSGGLSWLSSASTCSSAASCVGKLLQQCSNKHHQHESRKMVSTCNAVAGMQATQQLLS
jgi:hypothetical protein